MLYRPLAFLKNCRHDRRLPTETYKCCVKNEENSHYHCRNDAAVKNFDWIKYSLTQLCDRTGLRYADVVHCPNPMGWARVTIPIKKGESFQSRQVL